jgi:hypothetical protein
MILVRDHRFVRKERPARPANILAVARSISLARPFRCKMGAG